MFKIIKFVFFGICPSLASLFGVNQKPNIVVFISDDLGRLDTSIHGSKDARTPTMERLAAEGMTFDDAYVASPSCCPSRFSLLTGLLPARHGAHPNHSQVKLGTQFLPPILKKMGYHIASFGKIAHGNKKFQGLDFNEPKRTDMCVEVEKYFKNNKIEGPICLLVGDRRPHVEWTQEMNFDPKKITLLLSSLIPKRPANTGQDTLLISRGWIRKWVEC